MYFNIFIYQEIIKLNEKINLLEKQSIINLLNYS